MCPPSNESLYSHIENINFTGACTYILWCDPNVTQITKIITEFLTVMLKPIKFIWRCVFY